MTNPEIHSFGNQALLLKWNLQIDEISGSYLFNMDKMLKQHFPHEISETVITYNEIAVYLKTHAQISAITSELNRLDWSWQQSASNTRKLSIPVCYDPIFASDIGEVATSSKISETEVVKLHSQAAYEVRFIGFLPGFPYLSGLHPKLHLARKESPQQFVPAGSVAIGGGQTGIYSQQSPGGWWIIGNTPLKLFSKEADPHTLLRAGDSVQFVRVSKEEHREIERQVLKGTYELEISN